MPPKKHARDRSFRRLSSTCAHIPSKAKRKHPTTVKLYAKSTLGADGKVLETVFAPEAGERGVVRGTPPCSVSLGAVPAGGEEDEALELAAAVRARFVGGIAAMFGVASIERHRRSITRNISNTTNHSTKSCTRLWSCGQMPRHPLTRVTHSLSCVSSGLPPAALSTGYYYGLTRRSGPPSRAPPWPAAG